MRRKCGAVDPVLIKAARFLAWHAYDMTYMITTVEVIAICLFTLFDKLRPALMSPCAGVRSPRAIRRGAASMLAMSHAATGSRSGRAATDATFDPQATPDACDDVGGLAREVARVRERVELPARGNIVVIAYNSELLRDETDLYRNFLEFFNLATHSLEFERDVNRFIDAIVASISLHLSANLAGPSAIDPNDNEALARMILGSPFGIATQFLLNGENADILAAALEAGLTAPRGQTGDRR